ncbi:helix-turn-helix transcriptional regulator [Kitasatospora sp. NPDC057015]|uniref:helix-turn-helix transcriptional regulator n=1 Tax=Kitasatospora sp. NPDC057015 TaxID=3346001 RepID=UPI0036407339
MAPAAAVPVRSVGAQAVALPILRSGPGIRQARGRAAPAPAPAVGRPLRPARALHGRPLRYDDQPPGGYPGHDRAGAAATAGRTDGVLRAPGERVWRLVWSLGPSPVPGAGGDPHDDGRPGRPLLVPGAVALVPPHRVDWIEAAAAASTLGEVEFCWPGSPPEQSQPWVRLPRSPDPSPVLLEYLLWLGTARTSRWREMAAQSLWMVLSLLLEGGTQDGPAAGDPGSPAPRVPAALPPRAALIAVRAAADDADRADADRADPERARPELAAALRYVREAWREGPRPLTLVELAGAASVSRGHFARMFQAHFGVGAITALEQVRLARAERLLAVGDLNVSQVARACGFADPLHFSRRFRATHGLAPQVFRQDPGAATSRCDGPAVRALLRLTGI